MGSSDGVGGMLEVAFATAGGDEAAGAAAAGAGAAAAGAGAAAAGAGAVAAQLTQVRRASFVPALLQVYRSTAAPAACLASAAAF